MTTSNSISVKPRLLDERGTSGMVVNSICETNPRKATRTRAPSENGGSRRLRHAAGRGVGGWDSTFDVLGRPRRFSGEPAAGTGIPIKGLLDLLGGRGRARRRLIKGIRASQRQGKTDRWRDSKCKATKNGVHVRKASSGVVAGMKGIKSRIRHVLMAGKPSGQVGCDGRWRLLLAWTIPGGRAGKPAKQAGQRSRHGRFGEKTSIGSVRSRPFTSQLVEHSPTTGYSTRMMLLMARLKQPDAANNPNLKESRATCYEMPPNPKSCPTTLFEQDLGSS